MSFLEKLAASLFLLGGSHCAIQNLLLIHSLCNRPENQLVNSTLFLFYFLPAQLNLKLTWQPCTDHRFSRPPWRAPLRSWRPCWPPTPCGSGWEPGSGPLHHLFTIFVFFCYFAWQSLRKFIHFAFYSLCNYVKRETFDPTAFYFQYWKGKSSKVRKGLLLKKS